MLMSRALRARDAAHWATSVKHACVLVCILGFCGCGQEPDDNPLLGMWGSHITFNSGQNTNFWLFVFREHYIVYQGAYSQQVNYIHSGSNVVLDFCDGRSSRVEILSPHRIRLFTDEGDPFIAHSLRPETFYSDGTLTDDPELLSLLNEVTNTLVTIFAQP